jgi:hypothetical protein
MFQMTHEYRNKLVNAVNEILKSELSEETKNTIFYGTIHQLSKIGLYKGYNWYMEDGSKDHLSSTRNLNGPRFLY